MPLTLNCGLTKKIGEPNFGSRGASINVELELESGLINEPAKLQERIRQAFTIVRASLAEELNGNGHSPNHDHGNGQQSSRADRTATALPRTVASVRPRKAR